EFIIKAVTLGIIKDHRATRRQIIKSERRHFLPEVPVDDDDIKGAPWLSHKNASHGLDRARRMINGHMMKGDIRSDSRAEAFVPFKVLFDREHRLRTPGPPEGRLTATE